MTAQPLKDLNSAPVKTKQICVQIPERQALVLKQYCSDHGLTPDTVVLAALCAMIEGFEQR
jgi:hypothetical protein